MRWPPKYTIKKEARIERGIYRCEGYKKRWHKVPASLPALPGKKRQDNALVDHIEPVVSTTDGFTGWNDMIERMFVEKDKLQLLCRDCHNKKTADEREQRKNNK